MTTPVITLDEVFKDTPKINLDEAFAYGGCLGLTVWPKSDGQVQASMRYPDGGWTIQVAPTPSEAVEKVLKAFARGSRALSKKLPKSRARRVRDEDLI